MFSSTDPVPELGLQAITLAIVMEWSLHHRGLRGSCLLSITQRQEILMTLFRSMLASLVIIMTHLGQVFYHSPSSTTLSKPGLGRTLESGLVGS